MRTTPLFLSLRFPALASEGQDGRLDRLQHHLAGRPAIAFAEDLMPAADLYS